MELRSPAFEHNSDMPAKYTCQGEDISPPLRISGIPQGTKTMALIVDDPDAPDPAAPKMTWDHWVVWNIPPQGEISEGTLPEGAATGRNSWGRNGYGGPCPPIGKHRYFFRLYALDIRLELPEVATKKILERCMEGHILATAELVGKYEKT